MATCLRNRKSGASLRARAKHAAPLADTRTRNRTARSKCPSIDPRADLRTNWFIVVQANGKWWVDNEGHAFGPFLTREVAALEAVDYARKLGDPNRRSLVYWPADDGKMKLMRELSEI